MICQSHNAFILVGKSRKVLHILGVTLWISDLRVLGHVGLSIRCESVGLESNSVATLRLLHHH